jgi:hypothetical protein
MIFLSFYKIIIMKKEKKETQGYPPYPADDDITRRQNNNGKEVFDENSILLPDTSDIPGQEGIKPAPLRGIGDNTVSSADEEDIINGDSLDKADDDDIQIVPGTEADVTDEDIRNLKLADRDMGYKDDRDLESLELDDTDDDGDVLNEEGNIEDLGEGLDVPGSELDDEDEAIGEEDEENNL